MRKKILKKRDNYYKKEYVKVYTEIKFICIDSVKNKSLYNQMLYKLTLVKTRIRIFLFYLLKDLVSIAYFGVLIQNSLSVRS
jgi:hypothetical protein